MTYEEYREQVMMMPSRPVQNAVSAGINAPTAMEWRPKPRQAGNLTLTASCYSDQASRAEALAHASILAYDPLTPIYPNARQELSPDAPAMTAEQAYTITGLQDFPTGPETPLAPKMWANSPAAALAILDNLRYFSPSGNLANTEPTVTMYTQWSGGTTPSDAEAAAAYASLAETMTTRDTSGDQWNIPGYGRYNEWLFQTGWDLIDGVGTGIADLKQARRWQTLCPTCYSVSLYYPVTAQATDWTGGSGLSATPSTGITTAISTADGPAYGITSHAGMLWETVPAPPPTPKQGWTGINLSVSVADISPVIGEFRKKLYEEYMS